MTGLLLSAGALICGAACVGCALIGARSKRPLWDWLVGLFGGLSLYLGIVGMLR
jgi:hypothetical protein